jgi:tetratricopeptide (TPR) repeat protein
MGSNGLEQLVVLHSMALGSHLGKTMKTERLFTPLTAIALSLLMYFSSLGFGLNMDDNIVLEHPSIQNSSLVSVFTQPYHVAPDASQSYGYRPISTLSFALQNALVGTGTGWGHLINLGLFTLLIWRLFAWAKHWVPQLDTKAIWFFIALFAVHPLHVETVVSIKNRDELLALLFSIETGIFLAKLASDWSFKNLGLLTLFSALALGSKLSAFPTLVTFALAAPLLFSLSSKQSLIAGLCLGLPGLWLGYDKTTYLAFTLGPLGMTLLGLSTRKNWKNLWSFHGTSISSGLIWNLGALASFTAFLGTGNSLYLLGAIALFSFTHLGRHYAIGTLLILAAWLGDQAQIHMWAMAYWAWLGITSDDKRVKRFAWLALMLTVLSVSIQTNNLANLLLIIPFVAYALIDRFKPQWITIMLAITASTSFFLDAQSAAAWMALLHLLHWAISKWQPKRLPHLFTSAYLVMGLAFAAKGNLPIPNHLYQEQSVIGNREQTRSGLSEGRNLQLIENPLRPETSTFDRLATAANTMGHYSLSFLYPLNLRFYYGLGVFEVGTWKELRTWAYALFHLLLALLLLFFRKKNPAISLGLSIYLGGVLLFSNALVWVAGVAGDRLVFQASLGACLALAAAIPEWNSSRTKLAGLLLVLGLIIGFQRVQLWKDPITLMRHDTQLQPPSGQGHYLLAMALMQQAQSEAPETAINLKREAQSHFQVALSVDSTYWNARIDLSRAYAETGDFEPCLQQLLIAKGQQPKNEVVWRELCLVYYDLKRAESCLFAARTYLELHAAPDENIMEIQAFLVYSFRDREEGIQLAQNALLSFPNNPNLDAIAKGIMPVASTQ